MKSVLYKWLYCVHHCIQRLWTKGEQKLLDVHAKGYCLLKGVKFNPQKVSFFGKVRLNIQKDSTVNLGEDFICRSGCKYGTVTNERESVITVCSGAEFVVGHHSGMSNVNIYCSKSIHIGNHVNIGSGTVIYDTDFHSLNAEDRKIGVDIKKRKELPVVIKDLAFIGARCIILKGVTIGEKSIIGAGSVVACNVPDNEIWGGNPAKFIRKAM